MQFYRGAEAGHVQFPLDLDLTVPMMAGAMLMARQGVDSLAGLQRLHPGRRLSDAGSNEERGDAPASLLELVEEVRREPTIDEAIAVLTTKDDAGARAVSELEARAAIVVAIALEWVRAE